jgi:hypothetical protein
MMREEIASLISKTWAPVTARRSDKHRSASGRAASVTLYHETRFRAMPVVHVRAVGAG